MGDYPGTWVSKWVSVEGEKQKLIIYSDLSSVFERDFTQYEDQKFKSKSAKIVEDLLIIKYETNGHLRYKLVLSGWKLEKDKILYGTMYMYDSSGQFNGLPISLLTKETPDNKSNNAGTPQIGAT